MSAGPLPAKLYYGQARLFRGGSPTDASVRVDPDTLVFTATVVTTDQTMASSVRTESPWRLDIPIAAIRDIKMVALTNPGFSTITFENATAYDLARPSRSPSGPVWAGHVSVETQRVELTPRKVGSGSLMFSVPKNALEAWLGQLLASPSLTKERASEWLRRSHRSLALAAGLTFLPLFGLIWLLLILLALPKVKCLERAVTGQEMPHAGILLAATAGSLLNLFAIVGAVLQG